MSDTPMGDGWWQASDGKYYPPQSFAPPSGPTPLVAPKSKGGAGKKVLMATLGFFGLILVIGAVGGAGTSPEKALNAGSSTATSEAAPEAPAPASEAAPAEAPEATPAVAPTTAAPTTAKPTATTEAPKPTFSVSQLNAQRSAKNYLGFTAFSRSGLIKQLEFEGFSNADATFGVDAASADWNEQAEKAAKKYLELTAFSRSGLIKQLEFEGYTTDQATHGVTAAGL